MVVKSIKISDSYRSNDNIKMMDIDRPTRVNSKVSIYNDANGELIFEGHNKTVIAGSALTAMKLFNLSGSSIDRTPTYNSELELDDSHDGTEVPAINVIGNNTDQILGSVRDESQRTIIGFCVGRGGAGLDISDVFDVPYCSWISKDNLIPFQYPLSNEDRVNKNIYKGKKMIKDAANSNNNRTAYYFKTFSNTPSIVQQYVSSDNTSIGTVEKDNVYRNPDATAQTFVELHLKITADDCREFFNATSGLETAKINQISLVSAWTKQYSGYEAFQDIRPFSVINIPNEAMSSVDKSLSIVYNLYF